MIYTNYREMQEHGTFDFPFAFYHIDKNHPRYIMVEHWHPEYEIIYISDGELELCCDGVKKTAKKGDVIFVTGGCIHSAKPTDCTYNCVVFDIEYFTRSNNKENKDIFSRFYFTDRVDLLIENDELSGICEMLFKLGSNFDDGDKLQIQGAIYLFFGAIIKNGLYTSGIMSTGNRRKMKQFRKVVDYIHEHYDEDIDIESLAEHINLNRNYLCRFFKEICRRSPMQYINYYRIERACEKLLTSDNSVTQVAMDSGFNDMSYFIKVFKKYKGMTPTEFMKSVEREN